MTPFQESSPEDPDALVGRVVAGNFRIDRLIGSGATGNVYQAEQLSLGKAVAVKVLHPHLMGDEKLVKRFQREAKSASRLNHPNSVQIIESGQDGPGTLFIAMELLSGRDLAEVIRDEFPLPVPRIAHIMSQVFSALDEAHAHGIIHRDLKPSNIMLIERRDETDFVKVCDYGIAKAAADEAGTSADAQMLTVQGLVCGTPEYMSPEQARGEPLDGRTDLYSAAVILYQMTTGDVPFRAATPIGIVSRHLSEAPIVPSNRRGDAAVPADLDDLILRGLAKSRDLRPATAAIFRDELLRVGTTGIGRRSMANAKTLPATDPASNSGATTAEVLSSPKAPGVGRPVAIALVAGALVASIAFIAARREPTASPTPSPVAPAAVLGATGPTAQAAPLAAPPPAPPAAAAAGLENPPGAAAPKLAADRAPPGSQAGPALTLAPSAAPLEAPRGNGAAGHERVARKRIALTRGPHPATPVTKAAATKASDPAQPSESGAARTEPAASATAAATPHPAARVASGSGADAVAAEEKGSAAATAAAATPRGPREMIGEGEKLLAHGEVAEACRRGEDAKRSAAKLPAAYKFLGKCYMRAGNAALAKDNYRHYLDLAPNAPDAMFIESIVKESAK